MRLRPPAHIAWCVTSGQVVFLDIQRDRYLQLAPALVQAFRHAVADDLPADGPATDAVAKLVADGLLIVVDEAQTAAASPVSPRPRASLLEADGARSTARGFSMGPRTLSQVLRTRARMRRLSFERLLADVVAGKPLDAGSDLAKAARASQVALGFARWRPFVPVAPVCLLDSLALVACLRGEGLPGDLVFGVALQPFTAHCWVQSAEVVLNDSLDRVLAHTPILVV